MCRGTRRTWLVPLLQGNLPALSNPSTTAYCTLLPRTPIKFPLSIIHPRPLVSLRLPAMVKISNRWQAPAPTGELLLPINPRRMSRRKETSSFSHSTIRRPRSHLARLSSSSANRKPSLTDATCPSRHTSTRISTASTFTTIKTRERMTSRNRSHPKS